MGITIHYKGRAKSEEAVDELIWELKEFAQILKWEHGEVNEKVKGELRPSWGYGFGYVPNKEKIKKEGIEFFSKMVSQNCTGYFKIWKTRYADEIRKSFRKGVWPWFQIDTRKKGIWLNPHEKCETLEFIFDMQTLELARYDIYDYSPGVVFGSNGFFCKTHYAGLGVHIMVCKIIKATEKHIDYSDIYDEGDYYHTQDVEAARRAFGENTRVLEGVKKTLEELEKKFGFRVETGDQM